MSNNSDRSSQILMASLCAAGGLGIPLVVHIAERFFDAPTMNERTSLTYGQAMSIMPSVVFTIAAFGYVDQIAGSPVAKIIAAIRVGKPDAIDTAVNAGLRGMTVTAKASVKGMKWTARNAYRQAAAASSAIKGYIWDGIGGPIPFSWRPRVRMDHRVIVIGHSAWSLNSTLMRRNFH
jgi:hypothetical protein